MFKKKIPWMIAFLLLAVLSILAVVTQSKSYSFPEMMRALREGNRMYMGLALLAMFGWIFFEGIAVQYLIRQLTPHKKNKSGILYASANIYFSAITPSATGGQPASAFFMVRDGISMAQSTVILLINLIMYNLALVFIGFMGIIFRAKLFFDFNIISKIFIAIGYLVLAGLGIFFMLLLKKENWIRIMAGAVLRFLHKIRIIKDVDGKMKKLDIMLLQYRECADAIGQKKHILFVTFFINVVQRFCLVSITMCTYLSFGGSIKHAIDVWVIQVMSSIGSNSTPIPGSMGIADYLLLDGLEMVPDVNNVANLELVSRGIAFYGCVLLSVIIVIIGYLLKKSNKSKQ